MRSGHVDDDGAMTHIQTRSSAKQVSIGTDCVLFRSLFAIDFIRVYEFER